MWPYVVNTFAVIGFLVTFFTFSFVGVAIFLGMCQKHKEEENIIIGRVTRCNRCNGLHQAGVHHDCKES
jgi:hypothetical protein